MELNPFSFLIPGYGGYYVANVLAIGAQIGLLVFLVWAYRRDKRNVPIFASLLMLYFTGTYLEGYAGRLLENQMSSGGLLNPIHSFGFSLVSLLRFGSATILAIWFFSSVAGKPQERSAAWEREFDEFTSKLFTSDRFLLAANQALPRHEDDAQFGLDWIPWILENISRKRVQFQRSATLFLVLTILVGFLFATVVIFYGYILVNDAAAGSGRVLSAVEHHSEIISESLRELSKYNFDNPEFQRTHRPTVEALLKLPLSEKHAAIAVRIKDAVDRCRRGGALTVLADDLDAIKKDVVAEDDESKKLIAALTESEQIVSGFAQRNLPLVGRVEASVKELDRLLPDVQKSLERQDVRLVELLKRFAVGIVVVAFLLSILKYLVRLHRDHHDEMVTSLREEIQVRRFYIAFKGAEAGSKERNAIAQAFIQGAAPSAQGKGESENESKAHAEVIKELMSLLSKKL